MSIASDAVLQEAFPVVPSPFAACSCAASFAAILVMIWFF